MFPQELGDGVILGLILFNSSYNLVGLTLLSEHFADYQKSVGQGCVAMFKGSFKFVASHTSSLYPGSPLLQALFENP